MKVKLQRSGAPGAFWTLTRQIGGAAELLEPCPELDEIVSGGLAWCEAAFVDGRWTIQRLIATPLPAAADRAALRPTPRERRFRIVASN